MSAGIDEKPEDFLDLICRLREPRYNFAMFPIQRKSKLQPAIAWLLVVVFALTSSLSTTCRCWAMSDCGRHDCDLSVCGEAHCEATNSPTLDCGCCGEPTSTETITSICGCGDDCKCHCQHDRSTLPYLTPRISDVNDWQFVSLSKSLLVSRDFAEQTLLISSPFQARPIGALHRCILLSRFTL